MMRVLIVSSGEFFSDYGGGQVYVRQLVDELVQGGAEVAIATPSTGEGLPKKYGKCPVYGFSPPGSGAVREDIRKLVADARPDVVHAHGAKAAFAETCSSLGVPCIVTAHHGGILCPAGALLNHRGSICDVRASQKACLPCVLKNIRWGIGSWPLLRLVPHAVRLRAGKVLRRLPFLPYATPVGTAALSIAERLDAWGRIRENASLLIAPSAAMAKAMIRNGAMGEKVKLVGHGVTPGRFPDRGSGQSPDSSDAPLRFFYVGRIAYVKGLHILLRAFSSMEDNAELHIIGGAGNRQEERYMQGLKRTYASDRRIVWHGKIAKDAVDSLISRFDVLVHPTICLEVFGLNIAEAFLCGKPVVATRCGGAEQQVRDGVNGLLVEPGEPGQLASAMRRFSVGEIDKEAMGRAGKDSVTLMPEHASELLGIYARLRSRRENDG